MDPITLRTKHISVSVSYDGSFATDVRKQEPFPENVLLQLTQFSGVIKLSALPDSSKLQVVSTMKSLIHDRGPKQNVNGSPWVGSAEGISELPVQKKRKTKHRESPSAGAVASHYELSNILNKLAESLIHVRGPKQNANGPPWVGSVEGISDVKQVYADGTIIISPYQTENMSPKLPCVRLVV